MHVGNSKEKRKSGDLCYNNETGMLYKKYKNGKERTLKATSISSVKTNRKYYTYHVTENDVCTRKYAHRYIWEMHHGQIPEGMFIDHIDGNSLNNRIGNLRCVTPSQNSHNLNNKLSTKTRGVYWSKWAKKWTASITVNYKSIHLGYFVNKEDAILRREEANGFYNPDPLTRKEGENSISSA